MTGDLYCKVYLRSDASADMLKATVSDVTGGSFVLRTLTTDRLTIDLFENRTGSSDGPFVNWPYYLEVEPVGRVISANAFTASVQSLLDALQDRGVAVVVSSDLESQLQGSKCP